MPHIRDLTPLVRILRGLRNDVLLYLICKNKMDVMQISLSELTDEYIAYLNKMAELNIEIATEFLVMADINPPFFQFILQ